METLLLLFAAKKYMQYFMCYNDQTLWVSGSADHAPNYIQTFDLAYDSLTSDFTSTFHLRWKIHPLVQWLNGLIWLKLSKFSIYLNIWFDFKAWPNNYNNGYFDSNSSYTTYQWTSTLNTFSWCKIFTLSHTPFLWKYHKSPITSSPFITSHDIEAFKSKCNPFSQDLFYGENK